MTIQPLQTSFLDLPNELLLKIAKHLPRENIFFEFAQLNRRCRAVVNGNLNSLPLFDVHCHVHVVDSVPGYAYKGDGTDAIISYSFTVFNESLPDYKQKRRLCLRGNDPNFRELHVTHLNGSTMDAEFERADLDIRVPSAVAKTLLRYMRVTAMRFQVRKQCRNESRRIQDDFFSDCVEFCERMCTKVDVKSLLLCSKSVLFPWSLGPQSLKRLANLRGLRTLILENMTSFDPLAPYVKIPTRCLCSLQLRLDQRHRIDIERVAWAPIDGSILTMLADASVKHFDFSAYSDVATVVTAITAAQMCSFILTWRTSPKPWMIRSIAFNSMVTIDEFRSASFKLLNDDEITDVPYCRFRTYHSRSPKAALELACYGNGNATQWLLRAGYID